MKIVIYGARAIALGICKAIQELYSEYYVSCFLVTSMQGNPTTLAGLPVKEIGDFLQSSSNKNESDYHILIGTPEDVHPQIEEILKKNGISNYTCIDSKRESELMENYYNYKNNFTSVHNLKIGHNKASINIFQAKFYKDKTLVSKFNIPDWVQSIQVGKALTENRVADLCDNTGDNISFKNANYCELTALYWIWKNRLLKDSGNNYYGLYHYRRFLDIQENDLYRLQENYVDVILQFPTIHEPNIYEHHTRYIKEDDWEAMLQALNELYPQYANASYEIFTQPYFYNYNLIIAKRRVLADFCEWLFRILERTEELSSPKGWERKDRYIGYLGESLMTLYFLYHKNDLHITHTGRLMFT